MRGRQRGRKHVTQRGQALLLLIIALWLLVACRGQPFRVTREPVVVRLVAADSCGAAAQAVADVYRQEHPWVTVEVNVFNSAIAERMLRTEEADLAILSVIQPVAGEEPLWTLPLTHDGVAVIVHSASPVTDGNVAYLQEVFRGRIQEWEGVVLAVVSREEGSGTRAWFEQMVMGHHRVTHNAIVMPAGADVVEYVSQTPGAIGYVSTFQVGAAATAGKVRLLPVDGVSPTPRTIYDGSYPLTRPIYLATRSEPDGEVRALSQWLLGPEAQSIFQEYAHFDLPPRSPSGESAGLEQVCLHAE